MFQFTRSFPLITFSDGITCYNNRFSLLVFTYTSDACLSNISATCNICTMIANLANSGIGYLNMQTWRARYRTEDLAINFNRLSTALERMREGSLMYCTCHTSRTTAECRGKKMRKRKVREGDGDIQHKYLGA